MNLLTFDIEDWFQSTWDFDHPVTDRVVKNTESLLEILQEHGVSATFFVQGYVARDFPNLVRSIDRCGHEIASHGHSHRPLFSMDEKEFRSDLTQSLDLIEGIAGKKVIGYRAPDFSVRSSMPWFFEVLHDSGILYDSSMMPVRMKRYGFDQIPLDPFFEETSGILEIPLTVYRSRIISFPFAGGGYLRLLPLPITQYLMKARNRLGKPVVLYMHPYEINARDFENGPPVPWRTRLHQGLFRHRMKSRLRQILKDFHFTTCGDYCNFVKGGRIHVDESFRPKIRWCEGLL